ncbi:hypothetical protein PQS90_11510 [Pseudomonas sp. BLCC-B13]|uniref:hypothetical protein n=1 Tax=Pseudomonas sp. BLCC-B13 TaxID=3025314 RepID=UPI00234EE900|nr:hypothetical protein [Pseudomonas sp. BLCC-B13]MDC7825774.1 hypothetical protein [Pseudomonas sp. BLCC-B13]
MKYLCLLVALVASHAHANSFFEAEPGDPPLHLTPLDYPPDEYDKLIAERLCADGGFAQFVSRPSFKPESCVSVYKDEAKYFISVTRPSCSVWSSIVGNNWQLPDSVEFSRIEREISPQLAIAIQRAWAGMLVETRYTKDFSSGLDGATYQFSVWITGLGKLYGETHSPKGGRPAEIVSLGQALIDYAENGKAAEEPLAQRMMAFEAQATALNQ